MRVAARSWTVVVAFFLTAPAAMAQANARDLNEPRNSIAVGYDYEDFDQEGFDPWRELQLELSHRFAFGNVTARANFGDRFGTDAKQYEIDAYPKFRRGTYMYLNAGHSSDDSFYPEWRYGAELFQSLPRSFEFSLGARYLDFGSGDVTLYTGSLGKYKGNHWVSFRPYVSNRDDGTSVSGGLHYRRYFATADDYVGFIASYGEAPEEDVIRQEIDRLQSSSFRLMMKNLVRGNVVLTGSVGWRELEFRAGSTRESFFVSAGIEKRF